MTSALIITTRLHFLNSTMQHLSPARTPASSLLIASNYLQVHVYPDACEAEALELVACTSSYALTGYFCCVFSPVTLGSLPSAGSVFARDRSAIARISAALRDCAGNFYINDKCTGAMVGQQPFGGARASGTNDKAGSPAFMLRWTSVRSVKESFVSPTSHLYPSNMP